VNKRLFVFLLLLMPVLLLAQSGTDPIQQAAVKIYTPLVTAARYFGAAMIIWGVISSMFNVMRGLANLGSALVGVFIIMRADSIVSWLGV
jgi:hypothetical protein